MIDLVTWRRVNKVVTVIIALITALKVALKIVSRARSMSTRSWVPEAKVYSIIVGWLSSVVDP